MREISFVLLTAELCVGNISRCVYIRHMCLSHGTVVTVHFIGELSSLVTLNVIVRQLLTFTVILPFPVCLSVGDMLLVAAEISVIV